MDLVLNNDDLLMEILVRVPAKSLIRLKSVCNKWLSLISSDHFCHQHLRRHPILQPSLILESDNRQLFYLNPSINGEKTMTPYSLSVADHKIVKECNGLVLLKSKHIRNSYCVYNPTTRRSRKISLISSEDYPYVRGMALLFNPSKSPYYKVVCVKSTSSSDNPFKEFTYKIEVYDSETRTWNLGLKAFTYPRRIYFCSTGVLWNNAICWCTGKAYCYFDMAKNKIETVSYPPNPNSERLSYFVQHLQESNGHLFHVVVSEDRDGFESVTMWELRVSEDGNHKWLLKYHHHPTAGCVGIARVVGGSDAYSLLFSRDGKFKAYSFLDNTYEDLVDIPFELLNVFQFGQVLAVV